MLSKHNEVTTLRERWCGRLPRASADGRWHILVATSPDAVSGHHHAGARVLLKSTFPVLLPTGRPRNRRLLSNGQFRPTDKAVNYTSA